MTSQFRIEYDGTRGGIFYSGETMSGKIILTLDNLKKVPKANLTFKGFTRTELNVRKAIGSDSYTGYHEIFKTKQEFLTSEMETGTEPGTYEYRFSYNLPTNLPSSFESSIDGNVASIRYTIKLVLVKQWRNQQFTETFIVLRHQNLNLYSHLKVPESLTVEKYFSSGATEAIRVHASIPISGFVSGQNVPVLVRMTNGSGKLDFDVDIELNQMIQMTASAPSHYTLSKTQTLVKTQIEGFAYNEERVHSVTLRIPAVPPATITDLNSIVNIQYALIVTIKGKNTRHDVRSSIPITIGTVPYDDMYSSKQLWEGETGAVLVLQPKDVPSYEESVSDMKKKPIDLRKY